MDADTTRELTLRLARATLNFLRCPNIQTLTIDAPRRRIDVLASSGARYLIVLDRHPPSGTHVSLAAVHRWRQSATAVRVSHAGLALRGLRTLAYWDPGEGPAARIEGERWLWRRAPEDPWSPL